MRVCWTEALAGTRTRTRVQLLRRLSTALSLPALHSLLLPPLRVRTALVHHAPLLLDVEVHLRPLRLHPVPHQLEDPHHGKQDLTQQRTVLFLSFSPRTYHVLHDGARVIVHLAHRLLVLVLDLRENRVLTILHQSHVFLALNSDHSDYPLHVTQLLHLVVFYVQLFLLVHFLSPYSTLSTLRESRSHAASPSPHTRSTAGTLPPSTHHPAHRRTDQERNGLLIAVVLFGKPVVLLQLRLRKGNIGESPLRILHLTER